MITVITVGSQSVNLVSTPTSPAAPKSIQYRGSDAVASVVSPFTGQVQTQQWPGADLWKWTVTMPPMTQADADQWISFLLELRGMSNAFQLGDPLKQTPRGTPSGSPVVNNSVATNAAGSITLGTSGWTPSTNNLLMIGDLIQVGYRLYKVIGSPVNSDASGNATINIWPSLREVPTNAEVIVTSQTQGLFRLATNDRDWITDETLTTQMSFPIQEYR